MSEFRLLAISGSTRASATNRKLLHEAARLFDPAEYVEADIRLPLYDGDEEAAHGIPEPVRTLSGQIGDADAVIISTPEYNKGPSGVLKNALDWVSRVKPHPWTGKPVAVMSAASGRSGGERAQMVLRTFLVPFQPRLITGPEVHLAASAKQFDDEGRLVGELYEQTLQKLMDKLRDEIQRS